MALLVPVPSASHLLQQAQGIQWMAPLARVPSAPQVGSPHGRPYGWRRRSRPPVPLPASAPGLVDVT